MCIARSIGIQTAGAFDCHAACLIMLTEGFDCGLLTECCDGSLVFKRTNQGGPALELFSKGRERRKFSRFVKKLSVHIDNRSHKVSKKTGDIGENELPLHDFTGKDISRGGLGFYSDTAYEPGTILAITIRISDIKDDSGRTPMYLMASSIPVRADVRVVWCKTTGGGDSAYEIGVEFMEIYGDDYKILQRHLAE